MESPESIAGKKILISVLNWGMGHVSRSIGLIHLLLKKNNTIIIASSAEQIIVFKEYFPNCTYIHHEGYPFNFKGKGNFSIDLMLQSKSLIHRLKKEKQEVESYVEKFSIDLVLSDHRYGFYHDNVPSVFITHQLNLPLRWYQKSIQLLHRKLINNFHSIWVMDSESNQFAGDLSRKNDFSNLVYIGSFSRFMFYDIPKQKKNHTVYIASGPEIYAKEFVEKFYPKEKNEDAILIAPNDDKFTSWKQKDQIILSACKIVSRSGYSTIMDAYFLKCETEFIPTKGQAEQEYLAKLNKKNPTS